MTPLYIGHEIYRHSTYGASHPLAIPRVSTCTDLVRALGWLPHEQFREAPMASDAELARFHDTGYIAALRRAEAAQAATPADQARYAIGALNNPVYAEVFRRPATSAGGVMLACRLALAGRVVHCPGGGTHHGRPDRASGFCYLNDCVLGLLAWKDAGVPRIAYLDLDAHHGDGVQDAFAHDPDVLTISLHEADRWPHTGAVDDPGEAIRNLPLPKGCNDDEYRFVLEHAVWPLLVRFRPDALMVQAGADGLEEDPLAKLSISNNVLWAAVAHSRRLATCLVVTGGGGYNPYTVGRCWAGIWGTLNGYEAPVPLPPAAQAVLRGLRYNRAVGRNPPAHWSTTLRDAPRPGPVRPEVRALATCFD